MADATLVTIGAEVSCSDGVCGKVTRVVVDPVARSVTDLVVEPPHRHGPGRLVPLRLVDAAPAEVRLDCTMAEFQRLDCAEETQFVAGTHGYGDYNPEHVVSWPYYGIGGGGLLGDNRAGVSPTFHYDAVPLGEVEIRRGEHVHAADGEIGRVQGLVIDRRNHHVSHVLLQEGHLWGRKEVAIPIGVVKSVDDGIRLSVTKQEIQDLPPIDLEHPAG